MAQYKRVKEILLFVVEFIILNAFWVTAGIYIGIGKLNSFVFIMVFLLAVLSFAFVEYKRFQRRNKKRFAIYHTDAWIDALYWIAFVGFLGITFWSCYQGFLEVSGSTTTKNKVVMGFIAGLIVIALGGIAGMAKTRTAPKTVALAILCFLLFDFCVALPFNWLFFFNSYKGSDQIAKDKKTIDSAILVSRKIIQPEFEKQKSKYQQDTGRLATLAGQAAQKSSDKAKTQLQTLKNLQAEGKEIPEWRINALLTVPSIVYSKEHNDLQKKIDTTSRTKFMQYNSYVDSLNKLSALNQEMLRNKNPDTCMEYCQNIKAALRTLFTAVKDSSMNEFLPALSYKEPTPLELIKGIQGYVISGALPEKMEEYRPLVRISLLTSIIIDILPLLLSMLYGKYKRQD